MKCVVIATNAIKSPVISHRILFHYMPGEEDKGGGGGYREMHGVMTCNVFYNTNQIIGNMVLVNSGFHM
jgi:hypothetical protein